MSLKQPVSQKRLTNVAIVRLRTHGSKFEIACYRNKVTNWREGIEKDIDEVLQTTQIFSNVSQGISAKEKDLKKAFGGLSELDICKKILEKGEYQVSDKERNVALESLKKDILSIVSRRCIQPDTGRPLTTGMAESAITQAGYIIKPNMNAKRQALLAIETIVKKIPNLVAKANMRLGIRVPVASVAIAKTKISEVCGASLKFEQENPVNAGDAPPPSASIPEEDDDLRPATSSTVAPEAEGPCMELVFVCDPYYFRELDKAAIGQLRVVDAQVTRSGDSNLANTKDGFLTIRVDDDLDAVVVNMPGESNEGSRRGGDLNSNHRSSPMTPASFNTSSSFLHLDDRILEEGSLNLGGNRGGRPEGARVVGPDGRSISMEDTSSAVEWQLLTPGAQTMTASKASSSEDESGSATNIRTPRTPGESPAAQVATPAAGNTSSTTAPNNAECDTQCATTKVGLNPLGPAPVGNCTTCGNYWEENIRMHMKSEWHINNVKRKGEGKPVFSLEEHKEHLMDLEFMQEQQDKRGGKKKGKKKN